MHVRFVFLAGRELLLRGGELAVEYNIDNNICEVEVR